MTLRNVDSFESGPYTPRSNTPFASSTAGGGLTANDVSRIVGVSVKEGEKIKGESRITYMPYEKKVTEYEERKVVERVPVKRKIIEYEQRTVVEEVPREVVATDYYAVENIKQYYKEIIPEKKIEMVPVERKVKKIEYIPVEKQIVHYPEGQDLEYAKGQSRIVLQKQGVTVRPDAVFRQIDPTLIYKYSQDHRSNPVGYVEDGYQRNLSNAPSPASFVPIGQSYQSQGYFTGAPSSTTSFLGTQNNSSSYYNAGNYVSTPVAHDNSYSSQDKSYTTTALYPNNSGSNEPNVMTYSEQAYRNTYIAPTLNRNNSSSNLGKPQLNSNTYTSNNYQSNAQNYTTNYNSPNAYSTQYGFSNNYTSPTTYISNQTGYTTGTLTGNNYNSTGSSNYNTASNNYNSTTNSNYNTNTNTNTGNYGSQNNYTTSASNNQGGYGSSNQTAYGNFANSQTGYATNSDNYYTSNQGSYTANNNMNTSKSNVPSNNYSSYSQYASSNTQESPQYYQQY